VLITTLVFIDKSNHIHLTVRTTRVKSMDDRDFSSLDPKMCNSL